MEVLILFGLVGFGVWAFIDNKKKKEEEDAKPLKSPHDMATCFGYVQDLLTESHRTKPDAWWSVRKSSPEEGRIIAIIQWQEFFGDQLGNMNRRIILTADFVPADDGTLIYLHWEVESPMHRGQVNEVMDTMKVAIRRELSAS